MTVYDLGEVIGPKGDPGAKGDPGKSVEITEATVEYIEGESSVEVNKSESDDKDEYTFAFHLKAPEGTGGTSLPDGGTTGQVLVKQSEENGDATWQTFVGEKGEQGNPGPQGEPGKKAVMKIGTVETATEDKQPNVTIESSDDEENSYTLGFVLPKGGNESSAAKEDITLSTETENVELSPSSATIIVVISGVQTENVIVVCSDEEVATVSQSYNGGTKTLNLTIVSDVNGDAEVTVVDNGDEHYNKSNTVTINVTSSGFSPIYGVEWDGTATTLWSRTNDALFFEDPIPYIKDAEVYSSPFDNIAPWSGMTTSDRVGGKMVAIPKFWYKLTQVGDGMKIQISPTKREGYHVSPAHMDRKDGTGERNIVYIGRYHSNENDYKSTTGLLPKTQITRDDAYTEVHKINSKIWTIDFNMLFTLWLLYLVEFADWNSQKVIGFGGGRRVVSKDDDREKVGYTDKMPYHTGTMHTNRKGRGCFTQYRNIEGLWDNVYDWLTGCYYTAEEGLNIILDPSKGTSTEDGTLIELPFKGGYPSGFTVKNTDNAFPIFVPTGASGSKKTWSCDQWSYTPTSTTSICLSFGGSCYVSSTFNTASRTEESFGLFKIMTNTKAGAPYTTGCRIQELP